MNIHLIEKFDFTGTMTIRDFVKLLYILELMNGKQETKMTDEIINIMMTNMRQE